MALDNMSRPEATKLVADFYGVKKQSVIDKYTRQLGKKASDIDELIAGNDFKDFRKLLMDNFSEHGISIFNFFKILEKKQDTAKQGKEVTD